MVIFRSFSYILLTMWYVCDTVLIDVELQLARNKYQL